MTGRMVRTIFHRLPTSLQRKARTTVEAFLGVSASTWRRCLNRTVIIGITGSVGKTTAKELLGCILGSHGSTVRTIGNSNGTIGTPKTVLRIRPWHRYAVVEAGTYTKGDLHCMSKFIRPRIAAILSVTREHYASFRTLSAVAVEKQSFLDGMRPGCVAWLNGDDLRTAERN